MNRFSDDCHSFLHSLSRGPRLYSTRIRADKFLIWWMAICIIIRLWFVETIELIATHAPLDEELFIVLAKHILNGDWLGPYNPYTLVKGPGYPLFIAFVHQLGIPLITAQQILYSLICVFVVVALRPLFRTQWALVIIFSFLLFNPFMHSYSSLGRIFRLGLSMPLSLCIFGLFIGLLIRAGTTFRNKLLWSTLLGFCFSYNWYTREEGLWMLPPLALFSLYFLIIYNDFTRNELTKRLICLILIGGIFWGFTHSLATLNNKFYGTPVIIELKTPEFESAMGGLMNIDGLGSGQFIPVSVGSQDAAFAVSPTFAKLKPRLDQITHPFNFPPSYYIWSFRNVAARLGYTDTLPEALAFYAKIGDEIQIACNSGQLPCIDRNPSIIPVWKNEYFSLVPRAFWDIWVQAVTFHHFTDNKDAFFKWNSTATAEMVEDYRLVTREHPVPGHKHHMFKLPPFYLKLKTEKLRVLADIAKLYQTIIPILFILAMFAHIALITKSIVSGEGYFEVIAGFILFGGILSLISILTYVQITFWVTNRPLFSAYPLVLFYIALIISMFCNNIFKKEMVIDDYRT